MRPAGRSTPFTFSSKRQFARRFETATGETPHRYLIRLLNPRYVSAAVLDDGSPAEEWPRDRELFHQPGSEAASRVAGK